MRSSIGTAGGVLAALLSGALEVVPAVAKTGAAPAAHPVSSAMGNIKHTVGAHVKPPFPAASHAMTSVTGIVKGTPNGKTFVLARRGGPLTVEANGARIRGNGRFTSLGALTGGTMVTVKGEMSGKMLKAQEIDVHARGKKGATAKSAAGHMSPHAAHAPKKKA